MPNDDVVYENKRSTIEELKKRRMEEDQRKLGEQLSGVLKYAILAGNVDVANVTMQSGAKLSRDDLYGAVYQAAQDGFSDMVNFIVKNEETLREPKKDDDIRLLVQPVSNGGYTLRQVSKFFKEYPKIKKDFDAVLKRNIEQPKTNPPHLKKGAKDPHKPNLKSLHKNKHHRR